MKFQLSCILSLIILPFLSIAQVKLSDEFKITKSPPYPVVDAQVKKYFSDGNGQIITVKKDENNVIIQKFDESTGKELSKKIYKDIPGKHEFKDIIQTGSKLFYIYTIENKKDIMDFYAREIHFSDGTFDSPKLILSSKGKIYKYLNNYEKRWESTNFNISYSYDTSKILINYIRSPVKGDIFFGLYVFDGSMNKLWGDETKLPQLASEVILSSCVTNDGVARLLCNRYQTDQYELFNINAKGQVTTFKMNFNEKLRFQYFRFFEDVNGNLVWTGYYTRKQKTEKIYNGSYPIEGIFSSVIDSSGNMKYAKEMEFPQEINNLFENKNALNKVNKDWPGIYDLYPIKVMPTENNSILFVGEIYSTTSSSSPGALNNRMETTTSFHHDDVLITLINKDGSIEWIKKLPKKDYSEFKFIHSENESYILFIENDKSTGSEDYLTFYKVDDATGNFSKQFLFDINDILGEKLHQFDLTRIFKAKSNVFFLEAYMKGDEDKMFRMEMVK